MDINNIVPDPDWKEYVIEDESVPSTSKNIVSNQFLNGMSSAVKDNETKYNDLEPIVTDHSSKIMDLLTWMGVVKDYVIETGSNERGRWEKWHSGKLVQWGEGEEVHLEFPTSGNPNWGQLFSSGGNSIPRMTFPIPFIEPPIVIPTFIRNGTGNYMMMDSSQTPSTTQTGSWELVRGTHFANGIKGRMKYKSEGFWK